MIVFIDSNIWLAELGLKSSLGAATRFYLRQKTGHPVQFEITATTREALASWIKAEGLRGDDYLFPSRNHASDLRVVGINGNRGDFLPPDQGAVPI